MSGSRDRIAGAAPAGPLSRRAFLKAGAGAALVLPFAGFRPAESGRSLRLGLIADLHWGLEPSAPGRLEAFLAEAEARGVDGVVQLGDFNYGDAEAQACVDLWEQFRGERVHVLGNHDLDRVTKAAVMERWGMASRYHSFDRRGFHFVVLDRNNLRTGDRFEAYGKGNYFVEPKRRAWADPEQLEWLKSDLAATELPTVVFVHQGLGVQTGGDYHEPARLQIEKVLGDANRAAGRSQVVACFCGHHHADRYNRRDGIHYVWINSASYLWVGSKYGRMAVYSEPLFAFASFHPDGRIVIQGRRADWEEPSPAERGYPNSQRAHPIISSRWLE